jgi:Ca2+-binding EF-hand superfamily protein
VFADIDLNNDGHINFKEFVISIFKYVVKGKEDLSGFAFDMYDTDNSGSLTEDEVISMVAELYGTKNLEQGVHKMIAKMDKDKNFKISRKEFAAGVKSFPQILHPAFDIQSKMRTKICGEKFWDRKKKTAARYFLCDISIHHY